MSLYNVSTGSIINANDLNQVVNILQQQSGGQEAGAYFITGNGNSSASLGYYVSSLSRTSTPVSVSLTTSLQPPSRCDAPTAASLTSSGFHVYTTLTTTTNAANVGGGYTIQF